MLDATKMIGIYLKKKNAHDSIPDGPLPASLVRSESHVRAGH